MSLILFSSFLTRQNTAGTKCGGFHFNLLEEVKGLIDVPLVVVSNKSDIAAVDGYLTMSTQRGDGVKAVLPEES